MDTLNVALVGCGIFGEIHAGSHAEYERSKLVAVCDIDGSKAKAFGEQFGCRHTTSVDDIADDEEIQAVSVATPDFAHREICVKLAEAGKHVLVEKPLATTVADGEAIVAAVEKAGVTCMIDFHNRYNPAFTTLKQRLDAGDFGRPLMAFARLSDRIEVAVEWFTWSGRTGPEWFLGSHIADLICWLFGAHPQRVFAEGRKDVLAAKGIDCYDAMQIHLSFPEGFATLETSWIVPGSWPSICDFAFSLQTTEGRSDVALSNQGIVLSDSKEYATPFIIGKTPIGPESFGFMPLPIRDFVRAVLEGRPAPVPVQDGLKIVKLIAAAVESAETQQVIEVEC